MHERPGINIGSIVQWVSDEKTWTEFNSVRLGSSSGCWETLTSMKELCDPYHREQSSDLRAVSCPFLFEILH
jgi:hypothetical protein